MDVYPPLASRLMLSSTFGIIRMTGGDGLVLRRQLGGLPRPYSLENVKAEWYGSAVTSF